MVERLTARTPDETHFSESLPFGYISSLVEVRQRDDGVECLLSGEDSPVMLVHALGHVAANYD